MTEHLAKLQDDLESIRAALKCEREAEARGTTRYSRVPGLLAEEQRLLHAIELEQAPRDGAFELAGMLAQHRHHSIPVLAQIIREFLSPLASAVEFYQQAYSQPNDGTGARTDARTGLAEAAEQIVKGRFGGDA